jgi:enoyl-CoA hydratase/long-chain 3-hydroxyacyl-CoA dehydrogenase
MMKSVTSRRVLQSLLKRENITSSYFSTEAARNFEYFDNVEVKEGVALIKFNGPAKMNTISAGMQSEVQKIFGELKTNKDVKAVVFLSSKPDNFIAGADIDMIKGVTDKKDLKAMTMKAHEFWDELKKMKIPLVAGINGVALGGGLEWTMYCDYRVATTSKKTSLGLPEVKLGLLPGMGGTYHLPKLVGVTTALDMILTGKNVKPDKAKKMGLVDLVVDPASLEQVCIRQAQGLVNGTVKPTQRKKDLMARIMEDTPVRSYVFKKAKEQVDKNSGGHYPSPYAILDVIETGMSKSKKEHLEYEATKFAELAGTPESAALIGIFKGMNAVKKHDYGSPSKPVEKVAVLGAGLMGAGIAQVTVDQGKYTVFLKDKDQAGVSRGEAVIIDDLKGRLKKKRISNHQFCETSARLIPLHDEVESWKKHFSQADLVIEAVFEDITVKHRVLKEMEEVLPPHAIFASNTSAIPIGRIAEGAKR